jgi:chemotaxis protein methyltransferase CheR
MALPLQCTDDRELESRKAASRDFHFTDADFKFIRTLVAEKTGIMLSDAKRDLVYGRLSRRLRLLGIKRFADYCRLLEDGDEEEMVQFTNAITTNLTSFFREAHHFDYLGGTLLPMLEREKRHRKLRIWSAGCSTGEEPYSLAITIKEKCPRLAGWDVKILATDLDSNVLAKGQAGIYERSRVEDLSRERLRRWFRKGRGVNDGSVKIATELQELITFRQLNLMQEWPMRGLFDVIFCRNVVIYFDKATQRTLFNRYADLLADGGHLFVGHSESLFKVTDRFELIGKTVYRKRY